MHFLFVYQAADVYIFVYELYKDLLLGPFFNNGFFHLGVDFLTMSTRLTTLPFLVLKYIITMGYMMALSIIWKKLYQPKISQQEGKDYNYLIVRVRFLVAFSPKLLPTWCNEWCQVNWSKQEPWAERWHSWTKWRGEIVHPWKQGYFWLYYYRLNKENNGGGKDFCINLLTMMWTRNTKIELTICPICTVAQRDTRHNAIGRQEANDDHLNVTDEKTDK